MTKAKMPVDIRPKCPAIFAAWHGLVTDDQNNNGTCVSRKSYAQASVEQGAAQSHLGRGAVT